MLLGWMVPAAFPSRGQVMQEYHGQQQQQGIRDLDVPELFWVFPEHVIEYEGVDIINEQEDEGCYAECTQGVTALTKKDDACEQE